VFGRAIYGGSETVGRESSDFGREAPDLGNDRKHERAGDENGKIDERSEKGVALIADLQLLNAAGAAARSGDNGKRCLPAGTGEDFESHEHQQDDRDCLSIMHIGSVVMAPSAIVKIEHR
jgi:hypothetical protein